MYNSKSSFINVQIRNIIFCEKLDLSSLTLDNVPTNSQTAGLLQGSQSRSSTHNLVGLSHLFKQLRPYIMQQQQSSSRQQLPTTTKKDPSPQHTELEYVRFDGQHNNTKNEIVNKDYKKINKLYKIVNKLSKMVNRLNTLVVSNLRKIDTPTCGADYSNDHLTYSSTLHRLVLYHVTSAHSLCNPSIHLSS